MTARHASRACALAVVLGAGLLAAPARAQTHCPVIDGGDPALAAVDADARLAFVRATMRDQASRARTWTWAWTGIGIGLAAGQLAEIPLYKAHQRFQLAVEGVVTLEIPGAIALTPLRVREDQKVLEQYLADTEANVAPMEACTRLDRAEELLMLSAHDEALHTNWVQHTLAIVLGVGYGVLLQVIWKDWSQTLQNGGGGVILGEAQLLTLPTGAVHALQKYRHGDLSGAPSAEPPKVSWTLAPMAGATGLSLVARF